MGADGMVFGRAGVHPVGLDVPAARMRRRPAPAGVWGTGRDREVGVVASGPAQRRRNNHTP